MRTVRFVVLLVALFIVGSLVSTPKTHAIPTITWSGAAGDGKWETTGNWVGGVLPGPGDVADIPNDAFVVTISTAQTVFHLDVGTGDTLVCTATCALTTVGAMENSGTFINRGTLTPTTELFNHVGGTFTNFGTIAIPPDGDLVNDGVFVNFGTVTVGPRTSEGGAFRNTGTFTNECGGTVSEAPTSGSDLLTTRCPVGGEVLSLDYTSLAVSVAPWILIIATLVAAAAIVLRQRIKLSL